MHCPYCGTAVPDDARSCPKCGAGTVPSADQTLHYPAGQPDSPVYCDNPQNYSEEDAWPQTDDLPIAVPRRAAAAPVGQKRRGKPHIALRIPLQILSLLLSLVLTVCLLGTALLLDLNRMLSTGGIKQMVSALFSVSQAKVPGPLTGAVGMDARLDEMDIGSVEIPTELLTEGDTEALVDWVLDVIEESTGAEVNVDEAQLQQFVEESTISEYIAEKAAGYAEDFINGTQNTLITSQELMALVEENEALIASTFQVEFTGEMKAQLQTALEQTIEENRINEVIHEEVFTSMQETISQTLPVQWEQIQAALQALTSDVMLLSAIAACVVLMLLLCALNFYNIPGGLTWSAVSCLFTGALLSLPIVLLQASPALLTDFANIPAAIAQLILSFVSVISLVHFGILILGAVLLVLSIVWRAIRAGVRNASPAF